MRLHAGTAAVSLAAVALAAVALAPGGGGRRAAASPPAGLRSLGTLRAQSAVRFSLVLRERGRGRLRGFLDGLENPRSPNYHRFLDARAFGARFGVRSAELRELRRRLGAAGVRTAPVLPQRTAIEAEGSAAAVSRLLRVRLNGYADRGGRTFHAPLGAPRVPRSLARAVVGVAGLDTRPRKQPWAVPPGGLTPRGTALAYDISPLHQRGVRGRGERVAIISFSTYVDDHPREFASRFGLRGPAIERVRLPGGPADASVAGQGEANLDIDVVRSVAPEARVLFFEAPFAAPYGEAIDAVVADGRAKIASLSWGQCDPDLAPGERARDQRAIDAAEAAGISIFVASGDSGAYTCQRGRLEDHRLSAAWPSASDGVVSVGGTRLFVAADGSYVREYAWEDVLSAGGGGGGLAGVVPRPSWQAGPRGVANRYSNGRRQLPDVSANADPDTGFAINTVGGLQQVGGTSAAAPFWAGAAALVRQYARERHAGSLGFVAPVLYRLAATVQPYPPFHDVVRGGNRYYPTTRGWDYATGLGSPDVYNLARDVERYLRARRQGRP